MANAKFGPAGEYLTVLEAAAETALWLYDKYPLIKAYLDRPKSLEELQKNVGKPGKGYDVHHIVEQTASDREGHLRAAIDGPDNLVRVPRLKHWQITGWNNLGIAPEAARQVIESIGESNWFPQAGDAGMTLSNLDSGFFKPD